MDSIGNKLVKLRGNKKPNEVAKAIGITTQAIWNYENNVRVPRDDIKKKIAVYYNTTVDDIFFTSKSNI